MQILASCTVAIATISVAMIIAKLATRASRAAGIAPTDLRTCVHWLLALALLRYRPRHKWRDMKALKNAMIARRTWSLQQHTTKRRGQEDRRECST